jgi:photosystem II stability/assembly factor-like uncharacterized protein
MLRLTHTVLTGCLASGLAVVLAQIGSSLVAQEASAQVSLEWDIGPTGSKASFRGISSPSANNIWLSGSRSTVLRSVDGGSSWINCSPEYGELELRSIVAHSETHACIASAGTPAVILRTTDAGKNWKEVYRHDSKQAFFDGMKFWDEKRGVAFSDPIDGKFLIVTTDDGGSSWQQIDPSLLHQVTQGEAAFAASNSSLLIGEEGQIWIGTGGTNNAASRVHYRPNWQSAWQIQNAPIPSDAAAGIFSLYRSPQKVDGKRPLLVAVGGDYRPDASSLVTSVLSYDDGLTWQVAKNPPQQFRSAVVAVEGPQPTSVLWVTVGPNGSDYSLDGQVWSEFSTQGFHTISTFGQHVFAAGAGGRFARLKVMK